ncbi:MAG: PAS domain S-box protein [Flavipsychrobacter sp.]
MTDIHKKILEDTLAGYWDWNIAEDKEYLSPTFKSMFGYEDDELENSPDTWQKLIFPSDLEIVLDNFNQHVKSKGKVPYNNEVRYKHKNGSTVWVLCTGSVIEWDGDSPVRMVGCHIDITKQKEAELELKSAQKLLRQTSEMARVGAWEVDLIKNTNTWSKVTYEIHEESFSHVPRVETGISYYKQGESRKKIEKAFSQLVEKGEPFDLELEIITAKGNEKWVRAIGEADFIDGKCVKAYGTFQDIDKQKRTQLDLELSERRFKDAFEYSAIGMALVSLEGKWLKVNEQVCDIVGYSRDELFKKTFQDITHPEDLDKDLDNVQMLLEGKENSYQMEKRYYHKYGHIVWVLLSVSLVRDAKGAPVHFISQLEDITGRKRIERKLRKANQEVKGLYDATTGVSVIATDYNGVITHFGAGAEKLLGYTAEEMINKQTPSILHVLEEVEKRGEELSKLYGKDIKGFDVFVENAKRGKHDSREWTYIRKDGSTFPVQLVVTAVRNENEEISGFLGVATDISVITETQKALAAEEKKYRTIFENVQDVFYRTDYDGLITEISPSIEKYSGMKREELIGRPVSDFYHNIEDREKLMQTLIQNGKVNDFEIRLNDVEGRLIHTSVNAHALLDDNGRPIGVEGSMRDVSDRKEKEIELNKTLDIVSEQNKRLFNFAHIVTHNLRSYSGNFELLLQLLESAKDINERKELEEHLKGVASQLSETIEHLSEVVSIQTANLKQDIKELELFKYVNKTIEILSGDINIHNVAIDIEVPKGLTINYIEAYLESILLNFISNAIKYRSPKRDPIVSVYAKEVSGRVELTISDNGLGIDLEKYGNKLFGMYNTFHGNTDANGIGLFITKNQIEAMGGVVVVRSVVDKGTTFKIIF